MCVLCCGGYGCLYCLWYYEMKSMWIRWNVEDDKWIKYIVVCFLEVDEIWILSGKF